MVAPIVAAAAITAVGQMASSGKGSDDTTTTDLTPFQIGSYSTEQMDEMYSMLMPYLKSAFGGDTGGAKTVPYKSQAGQQTVQSLSPYQGVSGYGSKPKSLPWV